MGTRFSDSEHVSPTHLSEILEFGVRSFGKTCSEWEHVSPTQNTFLDIFRSWELRRFSEKRFRVQNQFLRGVPKKRVLSGNTFLRLRTRFFEIFGVRSSEFRKKCVAEWRTRFSDSEHVSPNFFFVIRGSTRFSDLEHVSPKFSVVRSSEFPKKRVLEWEHVSPTQNTFFRYFSGVRSSEFRKNVFTSQNTFFRLRTRFSEIFGVRSSGVSEKTCSRARTRFSDLEHVSPKYFGVRSSEFRKNVVLSGNTFLRLRTRFSEIFGVRSSEFLSFGKTCSEWEHVSPTQNTFLRNLSDFGVQEFLSFGVGTRFSSQNTFLRLRTRFS